MEREWVAGINLRARDETSRPRLDRMGSSSDGGVDAAPRARPSLAQPSRPGQRQWPRPRAGAGSSCELGRGMCVRLAGLRCRRCPVACPDASFALPLRRLALLRRRQQTNRKRGPPRCAMRRRDPIPAGPSCPDSSTLHSMPDPCPQRPYIALASPTNVAPWGLESPRWSKAPAAEQPKAGRVVRVLGDGSVPQVRPMARHRGLIEDGRWLARGAIRMPHGGRGRVPPPWTVRTCSHLFSGSLRPCSGRVLPLCRFAQLRASRTRLPAATASRPICVVACLMPRLGGMSRPGRRLNGGHVGDAVEVE